ncbi:SRPBCC domain-containing protein [Pontibacter sp. 13R65]|uniref:SRPBCC domain-containing protein n=1 Tax=Pontibacter sp. 13R65 TaxID=3127458 RepID=UPI00301DDFEA
MLLIQVESLQHNKEIVFTWSATGKETTVTMQFESLSGSSGVMRITENEWEPDEAGIAAALQQTQGWTDMLLCLKAYLMFGINLRTA